MPFFSIITPTYNRADFISKAIESVLGQSFSDWEHIIIDDGSTDNTREIVNAFVDERIRYVYQENQERSAARNHAIKLAKGKYICLLDSDDYYLENHLAVLREKIIEENFKENLYYTQSFSLNMKFNKEIPIIQDVNTSDINFILNNFLMPNSICVPSSVMKQQKFQFPVEHNSWEDMFVWFQIIVEYPICFIDKRTTVIVSHSDNNITVFSSKDVEHVINRFKCMDTLFERLSSFLSNSQKNKYISTDAYVIVSSLVHQNQTKKSRDIFMYVLKKHFNWSSLNLYAKLSILIFLKTYFKKGYSFANGRFMHR